LPRGWPQSVIFLIFTSWVARIVGHSIIILTRPTSHLQETKENRYGTYSSWHRLFSCSSLGQSLVTQKFRSVFFCKWNDIFG
jgi:hypothetical protein